MSFHITNIFFYQKASLFLKSLVLQYKMTRDPKTKVKVGLLYYSM